MADRVDIGLLETWLLQIQKWEHQRQWCDQDELEEAEVNLERAQRKVALILCDNAPDGAPLPKLDLKGAST